MVLLHAVCGNCSLSINLRLVSINKTPAQSTALISKQPLPNEAAQNSGADRKQAFLIIVQVSVISWWLRTGYVICDVWYVTCNTLLHIQAVDWLLAELMD